MKRVYAILSLALAAMSAATAQPSVQFTPDSLTRGLWHFNETSGSVVHDTASGYDGTAVGTTIVPGKFGNARAFNGAGDYVLVPSSTAFDFDTSGFRVDVWFRALTGNTQIIRRGLAPDPGFMIFLQSTGQVLGTIGNRGDSSYPDTTLNVISTSTYLDGAWHLATLIRDRTARKLELFVDGISAATPIDDNFSIPLNSTDPLTIGRWESNVYPYYFSGQIDEVRISGSKPLPPAPVISVQPTTLNYGWVKALSSDTLSLQINNFGHRDSLRVTSIITGNPLFGVSASAFVIPPFGSRTISVWYSPTQGKAFGDTSVLQIASNDPVHPTSGVLLEGFGYAPNPPTAPFTADSATRGLWHIDEATGPTVYDSAAGNNGTAFGTTIVPGRFGNARSFNGNGDYVTIPSSTMFDFDTSSFSVDLWFRSTQTGGVILRRGLAPDPGFMISLFQNGRVVGMIGNRSDSYYPDELLKLIPFLNRYPIDEITIHPRTGRQLYSGKVDLEMFEQSHALITHEVIYNGDLTTYKQFEELSARFKTINKWMIGRGALFNPFLLAQIKGEADIPTNEQISVVQKFHDRLFEEYSGILFSPHHVMDKMKGIWFYLEKYFPDGRKIFKKIKKTQSPKHYCEEVQRAFSSVR